MDVQQLRTFRSVVATGSVRAAADALGYSPSAVSQQLKSLQQDAGVALLTRVGRGVEPTTAGYALADKVDVLLGEMADLDGFVKRLRRGTSAAVRVGYFASFGSSLLAPAVGPVLRARPDVRLELFVAETFEPGRRPRTDLQFLIATRDFVTPPGYDLVHLTTDPFVVALPPGHPYAERDVVELAELADEAWIDNDASGGQCRRIITDACAAAGFAPAFRIETHDYPAALSLVGVGLGITVLPALAALQLPDGVVARPLRHPEPEREVCALQLRETASPELVRALTRYARAAAELREVDARKAEPAASDPG